MDPEFTTNIKPISTPKFMKDTLNMLHARAKEQLLLYGEVQSVILGLNPQEGKIHEYNVTSLMNSPENREVVRMMMEEAISQDHIALIFLVTEAWLVKLKMKKITKDEALTIRPSEHPDREEVVLITIMTKTEQFIASAKIHRDPVSLDEFEVVSLTDTGEGTLVRNKEDTPSVH
jgi:hypothetical protein